MAVAAWPVSAVSERAVKARRARPRRLGALVLDLIAFSVVLIFINNIYGVTQVTGGSPLTVAGGGSAYFTTITAVAWPWAVLAWLVYYIVPEGIFGASLGKLLVGLCVIRVDGQPLGLGAIVGRNVMRLIDVLPGMYLVGGVATLVTGNSQRLGDLVAGTTVVARDDASGLAATRRAGPRARTLLAVGLVVAAVFTIAFDYFGRPPLILEGLYNQHQLLEPDVSSYRLGAPQWALGRVTYPLTVFRGGQTCTGTVSLDWGWGGWDVSDGQWLCRS
jgi:uncharacterized RDD family membrane protein YckC